MTADADVQRGGGSLGTACGGWDGHIKLLLCPDHLPSGWFPTPLVFDGVVRGHDSALVQPWLELETWEFVLSCISTALVGGKTW